MHQLYDQREAEFTEPVMRQIEKIVMLQTLDALWKDHLLAMDHLKEGIGLRGYAQQNPLVEYQKEGFTMFEALMAVMQQDVVEKVFSVQVQRQQDVQQIQQPKPQRVVMSHGDETEAQPGTPPSARTTRSAAMIRVRAVRAKSTSAATANDALVTILGIASRTLMLRRIEVSPLDEYRTRARAVRGFRFAGVSAGSKTEAGALDLGLIVADQPVAAAAVFSANRVKAARFTLSPIA